MCTLSVVTRENGYLLAMNRDEKISRDLGLPPQSHELGRTRSIYPGDGAGGTWIAANDSGVTLALLNWNDDPQRALNPSARSRGLVIPGLVASRSLAEVRAALTTMDLQGVSPFRLVGVFPLELEVWEWRWNSAEIDSKVHRWEPQHWFSSSVSDDQARNVRGAVCHRAWSEPDAGGAAWLQRLHASHENGPGPFSICVHREDAQTLSYTEVACARSEVRLRHFAGSPCTLESDSVKTLRLTNLELANLDLPLGKASPASKD